MTDLSLNRRGVLGAVAAGALTAALPWRLGTPAAVAADNQTNLQKLVDLRFGMFNHFNLGTFTDEEWAAPFQSPARFAPPQVVCGQWADAAVTAKMQYGILTTKHHDGFSLWPTAHGSQNVMNSGYRQDVVRQYVDAFRSRGLRIGLYYSIWDRTHTIEAYGGHVSNPNLAIEPENLTVILGQLSELLTNYGVIDFLVTDGYAWQMGQQAVSYQRIRNHVHALQPDCLMIDHGALSQPWLGDAIYFEEPLGISSPPGNTYAGIQGQTISNGWFWHPSTPNEALMSRDDIVNHLRDLEPKWTSFCLNCPPNREGRLDNNIVNRLAEVGAAWSPDSSRAPLPAQPLKVERPVVPVAAFATGFRAEEPPEYAIDGRSDRGFETCWSTWSTTPGAGALALPQTLTIDLGGVWSNVSSLEYLPKQWNRTGSTDGDITSCVISTSTDGVNWTQVAAPTWASNPRPKLAEWTARNVGLVRIRVTAAAGNYANVNGLKVGGRTAAPQLVSTHVASGATYRFVNRASGKVLDVFNYGTANGSNVQQYSWTGASCQRFTLTRQEDGHWEIKDQNSGKLVEVAGLSRQPGGNVAIWADAECYQQQWAITPVDAGYFMVTNRFSNLAMQVAGGSLANEANVEQGRYTGLASQQWQILPV